MKPPKTVTDQSALLTFALNGFDKSRSRHILAMHAIAEVLPRLDADRRRETVLAVLLHDIGRHESLNATGFYSADGARHVASFGEFRLASMVACHFSAPEEAVLRGLPVPEIVDFEAANLLTWLDMHIGPGGRPMRLAERMADIAARHGEDSVAYRAVLMAEPRLRELCNRLEARRPELLEYLPGRAPTKPSSRKPRELHRGASYPCGAHDGGVMDVDVMECREMHRLPAFRGIPHDPNRLLTFVLREFSAPRARRVAVMHALACAIPGLGAATRRELSLATLALEVGRHPAVVQTGFAPADAALFAASCGEFRLAAILGCVGASPEEAVLRGLPVPKVVDFEAANLLTWLDMHVLHGGRVVRFSERLASIRARRGGNSLRARACLAAEPRLRELFVRLEQRHPALLRLLPSRCAS